ncbi:MAG: alkaline phosphatase D family protein [Chitinophagales bacterium]|nr:alkaline phosphatase D family protein [Chitinophagales bacterium]
MKRSLLFVLLWQLVLVIALAQNNPQHRSSVDPSLHPFYHGVASGDPTEDKVIIWTRVTPDSGMAGSVEVFWQVATDTSFQNVVNYGKQIAIEENDYCLKVDVCGLQPATFYYYMFRAYGKNSITGRTKTAPAATADNDSIRFAVVSCADYENGYFNAYESISNKNNVDAVVHLGDYIYEYGTGGISISNPGRQVEPANEIITLEDYRIRHSHYKLDYQLKRTHQLFPFITVWDDHETCNNSWRDGGENHQPATEGPYALRKNAATSAYFTWMPLRKPDPLDTIRIFRKLRYGKLLDLIMLDTRLYDRDEQNSSASNDSTHKLMGPVEMAWFLQQLNDTATRWKIIGNQVMFAPLTVFGIPVNSDQWDGYNYERQIIQNNILQNNIQDVVILTGDIHTSWCNDVPGGNYNSSTGAGSVCVEFVGTSITSQNSPLPVGVNLIKTFNPHMKYINLDEHGYFTLDVRKTRTQADYTFVGTNQPTFTNVEAASYYVNHNERFLRQGTAITNAPQITAPKPSLLPNQNVPFRKIDNQYAVVPENTQVNVNVVPSLQVCPSVTLSIIQGKHGGVITLNGQDVTYVPQNNYNGFDTVAFVVCTNEQPPVCDTVYLFVEILRVDDVDTINVQWFSPVVETVCLEFDDLEGSAQSVHYLQQQVPLAITALNDTCFSISPINNFCGKTAVTFVAEDANGNYDTIVYVIKVGYYTQADTMLVALNKNSNTTQCVTFNDLFCTPDAITVTKIPQHGTYQWANDSCVKYFPHYNYTGFDTMRLIACDTCGPDHCDTLVLVFNVQEPSSVTESKSFVVFGMFPNPVGDKLVIQYYLYETGDVTFTVYSLNGQQLSADSYYHTNTGLQYAQLNTSELPAGTYTVEVRSGNHSFRKKVIKQ